jgi:hypothetical protein
MEPKLQKPKHEVAQPTFFRISHKMTLENGFRKLKPLTKLFFFHLCQIRNLYWRQIPDNTDQRFFRNDVLIAHDLGVSRYSLIKSRKELTAQPHPFIDFWTVGNTSWYRILDDVYYPEMAKCQDPKPKIRPLCLDVADWMDEHHSL